MEVGGFETGSVRMERVLQVSVFGPEDDIERILEHVTGIVPLSHGDTYDRVSHTSASWIERYRPLEGAVGGPKPQALTRSGIVELVFTVPDDQALVERVIEQIFRVHSYQEPLLKVTPVLVSRSRGLDDSDNPHRWWNTRGDSNAQSERT